MIVDPEVIASNVAAVKDRIASAGGDPERVQLIAVTKAFGSEVVEAAVAAGLTVLGESYVQEFVAKVNDLGASNVLDGVVWHFIGRLQTNKVRQLPASVDLIQSVDRPSLASEIAKRRPAQKILVQVNLGDEPQKGGCPIGETPRLVAECTELGLNVAGLMGVASLGDDSVVSSQFDGLRRLADQLELVERSMGMTGDLELAVGSGSTMVRVGSALFGSRPPR